MASVNKVILIGNLGKDPEVRALPSGSNVANVTLATSESYKDKEGNKVEHTTWHSLVFFNKLADIVGEYLKKGSKVYVEGQLRTREYEKDGVKKYITEIVVRDMTMLGDKAPAESTGKPAAKPAAKQSRKPVPATTADDDFEDDDIPF